MSNKKFTFIDLFAGCGGLSEGFYKEGFKSLTHVEIDSHACKTLRTRMAHYGYPENEISVIEEDIKSENIIELIENEVNNNEVDIVIGGPPCQSFSSLGRAKDEKGMSDDPRNYLFESYEKVLDNFKPKLFVFENVTGLLTAKLGKGKTIDLILKRLGQNYKLIKEPNNMVLNSCEYGVPQIRKRIILIGVRKDINIEPKEIYENIIKTHYSPEAKTAEKKDKEKFISVKDAIGDLPSLKPGEGLKTISHQIDSWNPFLKKIRSKKANFINDHVSRTHNEKDRLRYKEMSKNKWTFKELLEKKPSLNHLKQRVFNNSYVVQFWDKPSRTIIAHLYKDGNQFIHPDYKQERTLTPREAARLQSFPDDFVFEGSRTQQYKQIGNAVPPLMAEAIAKTIKSTLEKITNV
ncbi:DNA cytosine methyltransferase [Polaribacter undariae]|uniref:Cytosine-specific methyltransferase n=1 Tax=Polaribacter sejongensis TaxID=985043 RepID=A0AAJ1QWQ0_9FLAO|nr:DNA cytosine methyltransferase [Polaribacter undariae]MDN3619293.1 DNA cytosine methyltransferase [Polaribacter undariae]UWD33507.1 DNA cytosine methyltransferase [Polaribacter undariae]